MSAPRGTYRPSRVEAYPNRTLPARCNRRTCQARRNLSKHPALYTRWPTCHVCGSGKMYVDWYRAMRGTKDNPPVCRDPDCQWAPQDLKKWKRPIHRISDRGCSGYNDYILGRSLANSKHCPNRVGDDAPF